MKKKQKYLEISQNVFKLKNSKFMLRKVLYDTNVESFYSLSHPNLVKIVDLHTDDQDQKFLVLESGDRFLYELITCKLSPGFVLYVIKETLKALFYLHQNHIYIQGLKTHSIVFQGPKFHVKLFDFFENLDSNLHRQNLDSKQKITLRTILTDYKLSQYYRDYLKSRFCEENLLFLEDLRKYKSKESISEEDSKEIITKYFTGCQYELNVSQVYFEEALKRQKTPKTMFDELEAFIGRLIEENSLVDFLKSSEFRNYDKELNPERYIQLEKGDLYSLGLIAYQMATGESSEGVKQFLEDRETCLKKITDIDLCKFVDLVTRAKVEERPRVKEALEFVPDLTKIVFPKKQSQSCL